MEYSKSTMEQKAARAVEEMIPLKRQVEQYQQELEWEKIHFDAIIEKKMKEEQFKEQTAMTQQIEDLTKEA